MATRPSDHKMLQLDKDNFDNMTYSDTNVDIHKNKIRRFSNIYDENIAERFRLMQDSVMNTEIPILSKLLAETPFDVGYVSSAERYFEQLSASTPIKELKKYHYNAIVNNYDGLGKFAKVVLRSLDNHKRFKGREVKEKLKEMLNDHEIEKEMISANLYEKISK